MRNIHVQTLCVFLFFFSASVFAQVTDKKIKGTWILAGIDEQLFTDSVNLPQQDKALVKTLKILGYPYDTYQPYSGWNSTYNAFHNQFMMFGKGDFSSGFAEDSTFSKKKAMENGSYTLKDSVLSVSLVFTRMQDGSFYLADAGANYKIRLLGNIMVLTTPGNEMKYYFRRISSKNLFK